MMHYDNLPFYLPRFQADQEIESWIENALSICRFERQELLARLRLSFRIEEDDPGDYDRAPGALGPAITGRYADAEVTAPLGQGGLPKSSRIAFCPLCFSDDLQAERLPYFRKAWACPFRTHCTAHRLPLFCWPHVRPDVGERFIPENIVRKHLEMPDIETVAAKGKFDGMLHLARHMRHINGQGEGRGFAWSQQLLWERALSGGNDMAALFGMTSTELKRVVNDLSMVLLSNFGSGFREPLGNYMASFLGPRWLFGGHGPIPPGKQGPRLVSLRSVGNPARRRSAISLSIRILLSTYTDISVSESDCAMVQSGESFVTRELRKLPRDAKQWLDSRSVWWPDQVRLALCGAWSQA